MDAADPVVIADSSSTAPTILATDAEVKGVAVEKPHITDLPITLSNWHQHINWLNVFFIVGLPCIGIAAAFWTPIRYPTLAWAVLYYFWTGLGITGGYHRLWAHKSYNATLPLRIFLAAVGGGAVEGSIRWWARDHRAHHRYTDTTKDPYSVLKGFWYSHMGWMIMKQNPKRIGRVNISDLNSDPVVVWQHANYTKVAFFMGLVFPALVAGLGWGDWVGGIVYAGILRIFFVQQATFCVNSLAHWIGDQPMDSIISARDHFLTAVVTLGEGYHNFHHAFPFDYRNAIFWYQYDPTKWSIWVWSKLGLAYDLKETTADQIALSALQEEQKILDQRSAKLDWGVPLDKLPEIEWDDFVKQTEQGAELLVISGVVYNVKDYMTDHPGGVALIRSGIGKDATAMFTGAVHQHNRSAYNRLINLRAYVIRGGDAVEKWNAKRGFNVTGFQATPIDSQISAARAA